MEEEVVEIKHSGLQKVATWIAFIAAIYHLIVLSRVLDFMGIFVPPPWHRSMSLVLIIPLIFIIRSRFGKAREGKIPWYDWLFIAGGLVGAGFPIFFLDQMYEYWDYTYLDAKGLVLVIILFIVLLEGARRVAGWALPSIIFIFTLMTIFQNYLPGDLYGRGYPIDRLGFNFYGVDGIFGIPLGIASTIMIAFIVFANLVMASGGGEWLSRLAISLTGWATGGIAKAAVLASAMFGSITGSPTGNVATTGSITIPLMKRHGYDPAFAGAVEAVASTGGSILPPVMGAIAFIMAEWIGVPYVEVALAAAVPALIYYIIVFMSVHFEAHRIKLPALPRSELPPVLPILKEGWFYLIPVYVLVHLLIVLRWPPDMSAMVAIPTMIVCSFFGKKEHRLYPKRLFHGLAQGVKAWSTPAIILAAVGMLLAALQLSGLGLSFTRALLNLSGGNLLIALLLIGAASFILGMGLDATPAYITLTVLVGPALVKLGVPVIAAHLYVIYWGLASFLTPPVCLSVYVACGLSGASIWKTGWQAVRLAPAVFVVPIIFAINPALILQGPVTQSIMVAITAIFGSVCIAAGLRGYALGLLNWPQRILALGGGIALLWPTLMISLTGLAVIAIVIVWQVVFQKSSRKS